MSICLLFVGVFPAHNHAEVDSASELFDCSLTTKKKGGKKKKAFVMIKKQELK